jgi:hypothetical protein
MSKKIKFRAIDKHVMEVREKPIPASQTIPEWWRKMKPTIAGGKFDVGPKANYTAKKCFPLLDGITAGYTIPLWADLLVTQEEFPKVKWTTEHNVLDVWPLEQSAGFEIPDGYSSLVFKYLYGWVIETPKDWSCLIIHPIGYPNLPFRTIPGVVDTDKLKTIINPPFVIKKGFEGIIEKGTPIAQVIPIKRESWEMQTELMEEGENFRNHEKLFTKLAGSYGRFMREKKEYN